MEGIVKVKGHTNELKEKTTPYFRFFTTIALSVRQRIRLISNVYTIRFLRANNVNEIPGSLPCHLQKFKKKNKTVGLQKQ